MSGAAQQRRSGRHQQPQRQLHRIDLVFEIVGANEPAQLQVVVQRRPRREGDERRPQRHPGGAHDRQRARHVGGAVPLRQRVEHAIGQRLDRADDEQRPCRRQLGDQRGVRHDVLDLRREAEGDVRVLRVQRPRDAQRVRRPVEEIGIAEVDVARAGGDLRARILQHHLRRHGEEPPAVDGRNRTVPAQVLAAARRLDVAGDALLARDRQPGVLRRAGAARAGRAPARGGGRAGAVRPPARRPRRSTPPARRAAARNRGRARCAPPRRAAPGSASHRGRRSRGGPAGSRAVRTRRRVGRASARCASAPRSPRSAPPPGARGRRRRAVRSPDRDSVGWKPAARRWATADATPSG